MELSGVDLSEDAAGMQIQATSSEKGVSNGGLVHCTATMTPLWLTFPPIDT
jgi:hypothetical protein